MRNRRLIQSLLAAVLATGVTAALAEQPVWVSSGPADVGAIYDLTAADGIVYAATPAGVYRSTPSGQGWELAGLHREYISAIAARPGSPVFVIFGQGGLAVSRDAGDSWEILAPSGSGLSTVAIDPREPSTAYLAGWAGVLWKTTDSGASWKRLPEKNTAYFAMEFDPHDDALVGIGYNVLNGSGRFRRSRDGGGSFTTVSVTGHATDRWTSIGAGVEGSSRFYAFTPGSLCRTADGAATWTCSPFGAYLGRIVEVPGPSAAALPVVVATSERGLLVSSDGGGTWQTAQPLAPRYLNAATFDAASGAVYAGTEGSIYRSTDRGATWSWHGQGLRSSWISALAVDPSNPATLLASTGGLTSGQGPGLFRSTDEGQSWSHVESPNALSGFTSLVVDPGNPSALYGVAFGTFYRSRDAGNSWTSFRVSNAWPHLVAKDPRSPATLWAGDADGISRSDDGGDSWQRANLAQGVYSLLFDSHDPATLYAGSYFDISYGYYSYPEGGSIFVSRDLGATWTRTTEENLGATPVAMAADPFAAGVVYAGTNGAGVLRSVDAGATWSKASPSPPRFVSDLVADPLRPGHLYVAADGTVYRSRDGGRSWEPFGSGLDSPYVDDLAIAAGGRRLVAGTSGAGIYQIDLAADDGPSFPCVADANRLCLVGGRYALEVATSRGPWSPAAAHSLTDRAGYFGFPEVTGDPTFPEVVVKMLPDGALGPGGPAIFHASLTSLPYVLTVTDTTTGKRQLYAGNEGGGSCGGVDRPFPDGPTATNRSEAAAATAPSDGALTLLGHRFSVTLHARHPRTGRESNGFPVAGSDRWGYFSMPDITGDAALPEVVVKMVDFRAISGKFWVFTTGLTGFDYTLTVTDSTTGEVRTYESTDAFCSTSDTSAFSD